MQGLTTQMAQSLMQSGQGILAAAGGPPAHYPRPYY